MKKPPTQQQLGNREPTTENQPMKLYAQLYKFNMINGTEN